MIGQTIKDRLCEIVVQIIKKHGDMALAADSMVTYPTGQLKAFRLRSLHIAIRMEGMKDMPYWKILRFRSLCKSVTNL